MQAAPSHLSPPQSLPGINLVTRALLVPGAGLCLPMVPSGTSSFRVNTQDIDWATMPAGWGSPCAAALYPLLVSPPLGYIHVKCRPGWASWDSIPLLCL